MMPQPGGPSDDNMKNQQSSAESGNYVSLPQNPYASQAYHQSHGYGHTYHPPPQYNTSPSPPQANFSSGIHYTYLLLMALAFATVVQITKGGLFATQMEMLQKQPQIVYPAVVPATNLRHPNMFNNYYMPNNLGMPGMMNNPNMMNQNMMYQNSMMNANNNAMMMNNNMNQNMMMMNGSNMMQQGQQSSPTTVDTSASDVVTTTATPETPDSTIPEAPVPATTETEAVVQETPEVAETTGADEELPELVIKPPKSTGNGEVLENLKLSELSNFKNTWEEWEPSDIPVFFHIPKAGGSTIKDVIGTCHRFIMATEAGVTDGHGEDQEVAIVYPGGGPAGQDRTPFVNVDTTTIAGIARAKELGFADAGLADAVVTPFIYEANDLFTPTAKGRLFTVFRHPIDRAISLFYYLQVADWEPTYDPELKNWSIKEYAQSSRIENNWLTRQLSNQLAGELTDEDLQLAMEVVRQKFLVGLMTAIEPTMERCEKFFHWTFHVNPPNQEKCREALLHGGSNSNSANKKDKPEPGSEDYELLAWQNQYDLQLYEYIEALFEEQEAFVADIPDDFRMVDATCCKCEPPTFPPEGFECPKAIPFRF